MVDITNTESVIDFLKDIDKFFREFDETNRMLITELSRKEAERDDLLHEIELSKLNAIERTKIYAYLESVLHERRVLKDKIELINTIKSYCDEYIKKRNMWRNKSHN